MFENEIREKGVIQAPVALDAAILRHARKKADGYMAWLDNPVLRHAVGYVPLLDLGLFAVALLRGKRVRITPVIPGFLPFMSGLTIGDSK